MKTYYVSPLVQCETINVFSTLMSSGDGKQADGEKQTQGGTGLGVPARKLYV